MYNPGRGWVYMCVAGSGGGTRYARLPPVIEIIPLIGVSLMLYAKKTKRHPCTGGIGLSPRLPPVIEIIPHSGYRYHPSTDPCTHPPPTHPYTQHLYLTPTQTHPYARAVVTTRRYIRECIVCGRHQHGMSRLPRQGLHLGNRG